MFNFKQVLVALTAAVVFAQTGVTALALDDTLKTFAVFGIGMVAVFLTTLTTGAPPTSRKE